MKLCSRCDNAEIKAYLAKIWSRIRVLRWLERDWEDWNQNSVQSHRKIVTAIKAEDYSEARRLLDAGIDRAEMQIAKTVDRLLTQKQTAAPGAAAA
jgi:DNA-binding GntR family transcriptional regulator